MNPTLEQLFAMGGYIVRTMASLTTIYFEALLATLLLLLGYKLLRAGLDRVPATYQRSGRDMKFLVPGAAFTLLGAIILASGDSLLAALFLLTLTVAAGLGFVGFGYRLIVHGVFKVSDTDTLWSDRKILVGRAAPGVLLGIIGVLTVTSSLGSAPDMLRERNLERREETQQIVDVVDSRLGEALTFFREYMDRPSSDLTSAAE